MSPAEAVRLTVDCPTLHKQYRYLLVVPLGQRKADPVTVFANNLPLEEGLRRVAPYLSRPVVVDGSLDGAVNLSYGEVPARRCLDDLAGQVNATVSEDGTGIYRVVANTNR
jgi:type II secretory pathway component GspD/PulD (secretin)